MAKRATGGVSEGKSTKEVIGGFAEDMGRLLGQARNKAEGWLGQKQSIVKQLVQLRDEASKLLSDLGHNVAEIPFPRRGRPAGSKSAAKRGPGRPKGTVKRGRRKMSADARARISAAQKARWAKQKAREKK
jgi:hypothetical protein